MKRILFLFAVCILTAFVSPEAKAQCPLDEDCDPGEEGGGNDGGDGCEKQFLGGVTSSVVGVGSWPYYLPIYRHCQSYRWRCLVESGGISFWVNGTMTFEQCWTDTGYGSVLIPTGINVDDFDALKEIKTEALASLRVPPQDTKN